MAIIEVRPAQVGDAGVRGRYEAGEELILTALRHSHEAWTCTVDGEVMAVWGYMMPSMVEPVLIWALTTDVVEKNKVTFTKIFRKFIYRLGIEQGPIRGVITEGAPSRWLERAGFEILPERDGLREFVKWQ